MISLVGSSEVSKQHSSVISVLYQATPTLFFEKCTHKYTPSWSRPDCDEYIRDINDRIIDIIDENYERNGREEGFAVSIFYQSVGE